MPNKTDERPRVYLNNVHLRGFKSIEDLTIDFQKGLNILIGKNGSGKSNFMEFINQTIRFKDNFKVPYKYAKLEFISDDKYSFAIETERELHLKTENENLPDRVGLSERFYIDGNIVFDNSQYSEGRKKFDFKKRKYIYHGISKGLFYELGYQHIYPLYIKYDLPDKLGFIDQPEILKANIEDNYAYWTFPETLRFLDEIFYRIEIFYSEELDELKELTTEDILQQLNIQDKIVDNLKLFSTIEDVRFSDKMYLYKQERNDLVDGIIIDNIKLEFKINGNWLPWSQLSDGTRRLFYIIAEVTHTNGLILIEEPELGIHPHQFNLLMDFLKEQSEDKQIILSTHSPKALDHLNQDELNHILIAYYDLNKGTQIRHLLEKEIKKAQTYIKKVGFLSDYWVLSDLE